MLCECGLIGVVSVALRGSPALERYGHETENVGLPKAVMLCLTISSSDESCVTKETRARYNYSGCWHSIAISCMRRLHVCEGSGGKSPRRSRVHDRVNVCFGSQACARHLFSGIF